MGGRLARPRLGNQRRPRRYADGVGVNTARPSRGRAVKVSESPNRVAGRISGFSVWRENDFFCFASADSNALHQISALR